MRDVNIKPIKIEPVKTILLMGLASAVMGLSACNKSDSHKTAQTPNIASAPSEDVKKPEEISEQIPEQITEQALQNHSNAPIDAQKVSVTAETADDIKKRCRALLSETEDQKNLKRACYAELKAFRDAESAAQEAEEKALDAQIAAALSDVRPISECHAMTSGSEKENCYWAISDALGLKADAKRLQCRAMTVKSEQQACVKVLGKIEEAQGTALDGGLAEQDKALAAKEAELAEDAKEIAALDAELAEQAKTIAANEVKAEEDARIIAEQEAMIEVLTKVKEAMEDAE